MPQPPAARRGFTFLEMIATLAIILVLASILMPVYLRARESARSASCRSNLQQLGAGLHLYAQDHDGRFPPSDGDWGISAQNYIKNWQVFGCPSEPPRSRARYGVATQGAGPGGKPQVFSSYRYRPGFSNDDRADLTVVMDWHNWHSGGANILSLGGDVRWIEGTSERPMPPSERPKPPGSGARDGLLPFYGFVSGNE